MHILQNSLIVLFLIFYWNNCHSLFLLCISFNFTLDDPQLRAHQDKLQNNIAVKSSADRTKLMERVCSIFVNPHMCRVYTVRECQGRKFPFQLGQGYIQFARKIVCGETQYFQ